MCERGEDRWAQAVSVVAWTPLSRPPVLLGLNTLPRRSSDLCLIVVTQTFSSVAD